MTKDEINRRIAECVGADKFVGLKKRGLWYRANACGYTSCECEAGRYTLEEAKQHEYTPPGYPEEHVTIHRFTPPNYHDSLEAMHDAEKLLNSSLETWSDYWYSICLVTGAGPFDEDISDDCRSVLNATAAQRAEAFLRTIDKWEGGKS